MEPFWQVNPEVHGDQMARILSVRASLGEAMERPVAELCALAQRALGMSYDAGNQEAIQELVELFCGGGEADSSGALGSDGE